MRRCAVVLTLVLGIASLLSPAVAQQAPPEPQKPPGPVAPAGPVVQRKAPAPIITVMTVHVTDGVGSPLSGVDVRATGPVDRQGSTDADGLVQFTSLAGGTYRLHLEREAFIILERDISFRVGQPSRVDVMLTTAPPIVKEAPAPAPPPPPPPPPQPPPPSPPPVPREPVTVSIPTFLDRNFIGREPTKASLLGCADAASARLLQLREPLPEHVHATEDEAVYVVAGEGTVRINAREAPITAGVLSIIPRGAAHEITRRGRNPLILLSILSGTPCERAPGESPVPR